jgi:hypothetical protein
MINTGQMLKRPGESPYSAYRRFLIANQRLNSVGKIIKELKYLISKYSELYIDSYLIAYKPALLASINERLTNLSDQKLEHLLQKGYRPLKHCPECAEIGFHTKLFDESWLLKCPIHDADLIGQCHLCGVYWPMSHDLISRGCISCGAQLDIAILKSNKTPNFEKFNQVHFLNSIIKRSKNYLPKFELYLDTQFFTPKPVINNNHIFNLSVMANEGDLFHSEKLLAEELGVPFFKTKKHRFTVTTDDNVSRFENDAVYWNTLERQKVKVTKKTFSSIKSILSSTKQNDTADITNARIRAHTLQIIKLFHNERFVSDDSFNSVAPDLYNNMISDGLKQPQTHQFFISHEPICDKSELNFYRMPLELSILIYKIDLWTTYLNIHKYVASFLEQKNNNDQVSLISRLHKNFECRCPYAFILDGLSLSVYFPEDIFEFDNQKSRRLVSILNLGGEATNSYF